MSMPTVDVKRLSVGIGQIAVTGDPDSVLVAYGLGSCVGVSAYDPGSKVAGMVHVLLPQSDPKSPNAREPARFADTGVDLLIEEMAKMGAPKRRLLIKIAGGAAVLGPANAEKFKIGERNVEAIKNRLKSHGLWPAAEDTGGNKGRTLELRPDTGKTFVRAAASPAVEL